MGRVGVGRVWEGCPLASGWIREANMLTSFAVNIFLRYESKGSSTQFVVTKMDPGNRAKSDFCSRERTNRHNKVTI